MRIRIAFLFFIIPSFILQAQWQSFPLDLNFEVKDISFASANQVFFTSYNKQVNYSTLSYSKDGGATINLVGDQKLGFHYSGVYFFDVKNGLICGYNDNNNANYVWKTTDGGLTFKSTVLNSKTGQDVSRPSQIFFINNKIGFITTTSFSGSTFYKTLDGGDTWSQIGTEDFVFSQQVRFINENTAYRLIIRNSVKFIEKTIDGLKSWQNLNIPNSSSTFSFQNELSGFIGTETGEIYKTSDGGKNWAINVRLPNASITKINFITPLVAFASVKSATSNDYVIRTVDGGYSWQSVYILKNVSSSINDLFFFNENIGIASGNSNIGIVTNATTTVSSKRPTLTMSGVDSACNNNFNVLLRLTGTPPWKIVIQENVGSNKTNFTVNTPSFEFNYLSVNPKTNFLSPLSVEDSEGFSNEVGGSSSKNLPKTSVSIVKDTQKIYKLGSAINVKIKLSGCFPLSLKISENQHDTLIASIIDPNFVYNTKINSSYLDFRITGVKSVNGNWIDLTSQGDSALNYVRYLTSNTATLDAEAGFKLETSPNPFDDYLSLKISNKNSFDGVIEIFDARGVVKLNLKHRFIEGIDMLNFATSFESGIYFLRIKNKNALSKTIRLIKI